LKDYFYSAVLWMLIGGLIVGIVWGAYSYYQPEPILSPLQCMSGHVTIDGNYPGQRLIIGDLEICGRDIEVGSITGPSKLYDPGDPL